MRSRATLLRAVDGTPVKIIGTTMDITDLRLAEEGRQEAEANFRLGFDRSQIGMGMADLDGRFFQVNAALCEIFGRTPEEILGTRTQDYLFSPVDDGGRAPFARLLDGELDGFQAEKRYLRPDGQTMWAQLSLSLVPDANGQPGYFFLHLPDVSPRKQAEAMLAHQALHDPLTGLANRQPLIERIERIDRSLAGGRRTAGRDRNQMVLLSSRSSESQAQVTPSALSVASHCAARVDLPKPAGAWINERRRGRPALNFSMSRARRTQVPTGLGGWNFVVTLVGACDNDSPRFSHFSDARLGLPLCFAQF